MARSTTSLVDSGRVHASIRVVYDVMDSVLVKAPHCHIKCFYGKLRLQSVAAASPSVWFPGWMEFEQQYPIQAQHVYLSLGDKEERTKNTIMAAVGDNIRTLHSRLTERGADCTLEWNSGGHFKDADLRTAKAFRWVMEEQA